MELSRRHVLQMGGLTAFAVGGITLPFQGGVSAKSARHLDAALMPTPFRTRFAIPKVLEPAETGVDEQGRYASYVINQRPGKARLLRSGNATDVWGYQGQVPGPTIHVEAGTRVIAKVRNRMPDVHPMFGHRFITSTHLHGNASLPQYDGYANDISYPGYTKTYQWPSMWQPARTLWYHDHAAHHTSQHVYTGLAGQYHVHDAVERELMPTGRFDVPLTISDAMFDADGELAFDDRDHSGLYGDVILVNGRPWPVMKVQRRVYRFRILNASVSRSYRPILYPEGTVHVVATDGGFMPRSREVTQWRHGVAERYEILIDFSQYQPGQRVELRNLSVENNPDFEHTDKIMAFDVTDRPVDTSDPTWNRIPQTLVSSAAMSLRREHAVRRRRMLLTRSETTNQWGINGHTWHDVMASGFKKVFANPDLGDVEIWTIENSSAGWNHPVHLHLVDFQILSRNGQPPFDYERGPKDVVYAGEAEIIELIMKFGPHRGKYMIHCHNLPHEDHDMMTQFSVGLKKGEVDVNDPITADPPVWDKDGDRDVPPSPEPPGDHPRGKAAKTPTKSRATRPSAR